METITLADGTVLENATVVEDPEAYVLYFYVYTSGTLAEIFNLMNDPEKTATIRALQYQHETVYTRYTDLRSISWEGTMISGKLRRAMA